MKKEDENKKLETTTLAGGCFWCTEAVFKRLKGVIEVTPGYSGGFVDNPSYEDVSSGATGHAEAIEIKYDPRKITYENILDVFWHTHDPTLLNRQGNDVGTQYRSAIFYHNEKQEKVAQESLRKLIRSKFYKGNIVTKIIPFISFYKAEDYHSNFFENNQDKLYCQVVIKPKLTKLNDKYSDLIKEKYQKKL